MKKTGAATVAAAKLTGKAAIGAAKTAGNVAAKLTKNAADYLKSDDAAEKMNFLKGKAKSAASGAGSMLSGIRSKASGMISEQRNKSNDEYTDADNIENIANAENIYDYDSAESTYSDQQDSSVSDTNYDENTVHHEEDVSEYENSQITENQITSSVVSSRQESPPIEIRNSPNIPQSTPNPVSSGTPGYVIQKQKSNTALIIVIIVLVLIIGILGGMFFMMSRDKKSDEPSNSTLVSNVKETTDNENGSKETETKITVAVTTENVSEKATKNSIQTESSVNISCSKNDVNQTYADIVKSMDFPPPNRGFILDLNNDGVNEMIIPNTDDMNFVMYYFDGNSIQSCSFGNFMALDNFVIYRVDGEDKNNYIYYRDNYAYKSLQGYYSFPSADKLDIFINYPENNGKYSADWTIDYNRTENYAKGNETVDTFYGQPSDCHNKLLSAFKNYGFKITENSKYTEVKGLYYDELINKLSGDDNNIEKEENSTTKSDAPKATASISIEPQQIIGNGTELLATVSGNYSYFTYEYDEIMNDNAACLMEMIEQAPSLGYTPAITEEESVRWTNPDYPTGGYNRFMGYNSKVYREYWSIGRNDHRRSICNGSCFEPNKICPISSPGKDDFLPPPIIIRDSSLESNDNDEYYFSENGALLRINCRREYELNIPDGYTEEQVRKIVDSLPRISDDDKNKLTKRATAASGTLKRHRIDGQVELDLSETIKFNWSDGTSTTIPRTVTSDKDDIAEVIDVNVEEID